MFSILTPTYNRAHTLERVYLSLLAQTDQDFEWHIIDDASTDDTKNLVDVWLKKELPFTISYHLLEVNKGKPNALNEGLNFCTRPITIIADSDDSFGPETIADLKNLWGTVDLSENPGKIASIWTLVHDEKNELVGEPFPFNFWQVDLNKRILDRKKVVSGEKWHSWRTDVLKKFKMYHSEHSFISEGATWNRINKEYDFLCVNIFHRVYFESPDGLILKKKSRLEIEKNKFYNSYYQLIETPILDIFKYPYYHQIAFNYVKSILIYKNRDLNLGLRKFLCCFVLSIWHTPKRILSYFN
ncbi:glycosyltransferase family 2 protein [Maribacter sp. X9]|uniref:glycosyltransferase family 2 protein n=1 Tax=Maribacter sp. X9 TaxID=3402159 RepID=UPI003AF3EB1A